MIEKYGINPLDQMNDAYCWNYKNIDDALAKAEQISSEHNVDVIVFRILGTFVRNTSYVPINNGED